ncbi:hypothetical protein AAFN85_15605 [Mucilaginibacter sp. CAU 1740]|uniref:hypothetical protein n=1 Tax=Mucilaginibacter sp. CAU 1740 TaxID=3140365 RepID=UPI00325A693D
MRTRYIYFETDEEQWRWDFGVYLLIIYYANELNKEKAKALLATTLSEFDFRLSNGLPTEDIDTEDNTCHFDLNNLELAINFIDAELISALNNEPVGLLTKYGGERKFLELFDLTTDISATIGVSYGEEEFLKGDVGYCSHIVTLYREFLQKALDSNKPYEVYVY